MALLITITDAGRAEIINADNTGTGPLVITEVGFGTGQYAPSKAQMALTNEVTRLSSIAGLAVAADTIHIMVKDEGTDAYNVGEFGLYSASGTLVAVYSQVAASGWIIQKAGASTLLMAVDIILESLDAASLTFGDITFLNPPATTETPGVVQLEDSLTSPSTGKALTAAQGKKLQEEKAPLESPALTGTPTAPTAAAGNSSTQVATTAFVAAVQTLLNEAIALKAPLASPALTGTPTAPTAAAGNSSTQVATTAFVAAVQTLLNAAIALKAPLASPALTGTPTAPTAAAGNSSTQVATTAFVAAVQTLLNAAISLKAPLASPALTGTPTAPTAAAGTNTTQLATTAFVDAVETLLNAAIALKAPMASPALTGTPTAPTAPTATNNTQIASTAFVKACIAAIAQATEAVIGVLKVSTQVLVNAGADDTTAVTPKKLRWGFTISTGPIGYVVFPTWLASLTLQWGRIQFAANVSSAAFNVTFPLAFSSSCFGVWPSVGIATTDYDVNAQWRGCRQEASVSEPTLTGFEGQVFMDNSLTEARRAFWISAGI